MPVFNGSEYLAKAIESVLDQTFDDWELLISDDCSKDDSSQIMAKYAKQDSRIKAWTNEKNLGHYPNYNACIAASSGEFIKLFAQDDIFHPTMFERMVKELDARPNVSVVTVARCHIDSKGKPIKTDALQNKLSRPYDHDLTLTAKEAIAPVLQEQMNWLGEPSSQMYRATLAGGGLDESFHQLGDVEMTFRLLQKGDYFYIADQLCFFRKHSGSWTTSNMAKLGTYLDWILVASKYRDYLPDAQLTQEQYCLNFIKAWTRNLECELNDGKRLGPHERQEVLSELCGKVEPFSLFTWNKREPGLEANALSAMGLLQSALLENEIRQIHDDIASLVIYGGKSSPRDTVRPDIITALDTVRRTLQERDKEIAALRNQLLALGNSTSWKITEPLRKLQKKKKEK